MCLIHQLLLVSFYPKRIEVPEITMTPSSGTLAAHASPTPHSVPYWRRLRRLWGSSLASGTPQQSARTRRPLQDSEEAVSSGASPQPSPPPRAPSPALSTRGRKARCSLCSSDKSSSILAGRQLFPSSADPALATSGVCVPERIGSGAGPSPTSGSGLRLPLPGTPPSLHAGRRRKSP